MLTNRVKFILYQGKEILLVDASKASEKELFDVLADVDEIFTANQVRAPFLFLGDYSDVSYSIGLIEKFKSSLNSHRDFIEKYAAVGVPLSAKFLAPLIAKEMPFEMKFFETQEKALVWLVQ